MTMAQSAKTSREPTLDPMEVPKTKTAAATLLRSLGFKRVRIWRVEDDRVLFTVADRHALTLFFRFDHVNENVRLTSEDGWPA